MTIPSRQIGVRPWLLISVLLGGVLGSLILSAWVSAAPKDTSVGSAPLDTASAAATTGSDRFLRGMTVSCPGYGRIWGSSTMDASLEDLAALGVNWVSIHPYAGVRRDGTVEFQPAMRTGYLERAVELADKHGIELFWKPHLAYWGSFEWRGTIAFGDDEARWRRFFDQYREWIVDQARFAEVHGVSLFSVGLEYEATTGHEAEWRRILAEVRRVYTGRITYSANWDRLDAVPFWDAVDVIGVQAYFPLSQEDNPSSDALRRGWQEPIRVLKDLSRRHGKPVLLAEIGYDISPEAARQPWLTQSRNTESNRALRLRLMEVALETLEGEDFIEGMFWWKWIPGERRHRDFAMQPPEVQDVLRRAWGPPA